jgi:PAS domain S-box-containing protein
VLGDTAFEALLAVDDERRCVWVNEAATRLFGAPSDEIVGRRLEDFTPRDDLARLDEMWRQFRREGELQGPYEVLLPDGSRRPVAFRANWHYAPGEHLIAAVETPGPEAAVTGAGKLTKREREILSLVADGLTNDEIGARLVLSPATIKTHLQNVYSKLQVKDRAAAVAVALRSRLIS